MEPSVEIVFGTADGREEARLFSHQPLGIQFGNSMPIVVKSVHLGGQAQQLGIQRSWKVHSINGLSLATMSFCEAVKTLAGPVTALPCCMLVRDPPFHATSVAEFSAKFKSVIKKTQVVSVLKQYGFVAQTSKLWGDTGPLPELKLGIVDGHRDVCSPTYHTWYSLVGKIIVGEVAFKRCWMVERRLAHVRAMLHDPVKQELGKDYVQYFGKARFAHHGGPPGTTVRMDSWLAALSNAICCRALSPKLVAFILIFLEAPLLDEDAGKVRMTDMPLSANV